MNRRIRAVFLALCLLAALLCGCAAANGQPSAETVTVTDCAGRTVEVPKDPQSICCVCPFSGPIIVMCGYGDRVTTACNNMTRSLLLSSICPSVADAIVVKNSGSINAEEILEQNTDLLVVNGELYADPDERQKLDTLGIPYIVIEFDGLESQLDAIEVLGRTFGAEEKATQYTSWCRSVYEDVADAAAKYNGTPVRLYHAVNEAVRTDEKDGYCAQWIALTGAENVSVSGELEQEGNKSYTTLEEIYNWDPDMIICNEAGVDDYILADDKWQGLRCVREGEVYQIPVGISRMGHPTSSETPLALMWLMNLLHPDLYPVDFTEELISYYDTFYDYPVSEELAEAILEGDEMRAAKVSVSAE